MFSNAPGCVFHQSYLTGLRVKPHSTKPPETPERLEQRAAQKALTDPGLNHPKRRNPGLDGRGLAYIAKRENDTNSKFHVDVGKPCPLSKCFGPMLHFTLSYFQAFDGRMVSQEMNSIRFWIWHAETLHIWSTSQGKCVIILLPYCKHRL